MSVKTKSVTVRNRRTGETWLCKDWNQRRTIDGSEFIEVYKPENSRRLLLNVSNLEKLNTKKS